MAYDSIPSTWLDVGKAVKKELLDRVNDNLEDLNNRVTNVEGSLSTTIIANTLITRERDHAPIGSLVWTPMTEAQFQTATDDGGWVLANGQSVAGSDYATLMSRSTAPDARGRFLRMRDYGAGINADGDVATDTLQGYDLQSHGHDMGHTHAHTIAASGTFASTAHTHDMSHVHRWGQYLTSTGKWYTKDVHDISSLTTLDIPLTTPITGASGGSGVSLFQDSGLAGLDHNFYTAGVLDSPSGSGTSAKTGTPTATASVSTSGTVTALTGFTGTAPSGTLGTLETRPRNVTENLMLKINKNYITTRTGYVLWRAPQAITINQVVVSPVHQGTSGTLTIDVKKGALTSITTSIFSVLPSLVYSGTAAVTGTLNPSNVTVAAGEYVRIDITATQAKLTEFHVLIAATPV